MLYEYALTPDLFTKTMLTQPDAGITMTQLLAGLEMNGLLGNFNKEEWLNGLSDKELKDLDPKLKDKLLRHIKRLYDLHRVINHAEVNATTPINNHEWLQWAVKEYKVYKYFKAVIASEDLMKYYSKICGPGVEGFVDFFDALESDHWKHIGRSSNSLFKTKSEYKQLLESVLKYAKTLALVDYGFHYVRSCGYQDSLEICASLLGKRESQGRERWISREISVHASYATLGKNLKSPQEWFDGWSPIVKELQRKYGHKYRFFLWETLESKFTPRKERNKMHDRYIITDQFGISCPFGLDCFPESKQKTTWHRMDEEDRRLKAEAFTPGISDFEIVDSKEYY